MDVEGLLAVLGPGSEQLRSPSELCSIVGFSEYDLSHGGLKEPAFFFFGCFCDFGVTFLRLLCLPIVSFFLVLNTVYGLVKRTDSKISTSLVFLESP